MMEFIIVDDPIKEPTKKQLNALKWRYCEMLKDDAYGDKFNLRIGMLKELIPEAIGL